MPLDCRDREKDHLQPLLVGNASLFTNALFTVLVALQHHPPSQQSDGFPLEFQTRTSNKAAKRLLKIVNKLNYEQTGVSELENAIW